MNIWNAHTLNKSIPFFDACTHVFCFLFFVFCFFMEGGLVVQFINSMYVQPYVSIVNFEPFIELNWSSEILQYGIWNKYGMQSKKKASYHRQSFSIRDRVDSWENIRVDKSCVTKPLGGSMTILWLTTSAKSCRVLRFSSSPCLLADGRSRLASVIHRTELF